MPEITDAELRTFVRYQNLGTPEEVERKIRDLEKDNHKYRQEEKPVLEEKLKGLPKDNEVVLPKEKAELLEKYEKLGKVEDLEKASGELGTLRQKDAQRTREDSFRQLVKAAGMPEETVATLMDMRSLDGCSVEVKTERDQGGKEVQVPYVTLAGEGQKPQKFAEFAKAAPQLKGIRMEPPKGGNSGPAYPHQREGGASDEGKSAIDAQIEKNRTAATAPNPLRPAKQTT